MPPRQIEAGCDEPRKWEIQLLTRNEVTREMPEEVKPRINQRAFLPRGRAPPPHSYTRESFSSPL